MTLVASIVRCLARLLVLLVVTLPVAPALAQTVEDVVGQARAAASANDNREAARLFEEAIRLAPQRRAELLTEFADQLAYAGRPGEAVPLYREKLQDRDLPDDQRRRAERGLAFALLWSGDFDEAIAAFERLTQAMPADLDLRKALVDAVVGEARAAAERGDNKAAAAGFERALSLDPVRRQTLAREYADQLAYAGEPARAVPIYREILTRTDLREEERERTRRNLAFALLWSSQFREAITAWQTILRERPGDDEARKALGDALVGQARQVAGRNQNAEAATLFRRAIETAPGRRSELLPEYADQLAYAGRPAEAVPLYREALSQGNRPDAEQARLRRGLAFALLWSNRFGEAINAWQAILRQNPRDQEARKAFADALTGAARQAAGRSRNGEAAALFGRAIAADPGRRRELLPEYAEQVLYAGRPVEAVPLFQEILRRPGLASAERRRALLGLARGLSWSGQPAAAIPVYSQLLAEAPDTVDALIGRGQAYNALALHRQAFADFVAVLGRDPSQADAIRGAAQAETSLGLHRRALARLEPLLVQGRVDVSTLIIAAQARRSMGRPDLSEDLARAILAQKPGDEGARRLLEELYLERRPQTVIDGSYAFRSDGLRIPSFFLLHQMTFNQGLTKLGPQFRAANFSGRDFPEVSIYGIGLTGRHRFNDWLELNSSVFLNAEQEPLDDDLSITHETTLSFIPSDTWRFGLNWTRRYPDENPRAVVNDVFANDYGLTIEYTPSYDSRFILRGLYSDYTDTNRRLWGQVEFAQRVFWSPDVFLGVRYTAFEFDRVFDNGYWNPKAYQSIEATLHAYGKLAERWRFDVQAAAGYGEERPGDGGFVGSATARLTYDVNEALAFSLYTSGLVSYARSADSDPFAANNGESDPFTRASLGAQLRVTW